jgi:hypothetical protein
MVKGHHREPLGTSAIRRIQYLIELLYSFLMQGVDRHGTAVLALLCLIPIGCAVNSSMSLDPGGAASAPTEQPIASLVHEWFSVLETGTLESQTLGRFVAQPSFELSLIGGPVRSLDELEAWRVDLHSTHLELAYQLGRCRARRRRPPSGPIRVRETSRG